MDRDFWLARWEQGQIGFHLNEANPRLLAHAECLLPAPGKVFVPLSGKSLDLAWLVQQGYEVLGVELSELAVRAFFKERGLRPSTHAAGEFTAFSADAYTVLCGDAFSLAPADLAGVTAFYDRAALIALPPALRVRYGNLLAQVLPEAASGLLITLDYAQSEASGPPFAVSDPEIRTLFGERFAVEHVASYDVLDDEPRFRSRGVRALFERVYRLISRRACGA